MNNKDNNSAEDRPVYPDGKDCNKEKDKNVQREVPMKDVLDVLGNVVHSAPMFNDNDFFQNYIQSLSTERKFLMKNINWSDNGIKTLSGVIFHMNPHSYNYSNAYHQAFISGSALSAFNTSFAGIRFVNCDFTNTEFNFCDFTDAEFVNCKFTGTNFYGSKIDGVDTKTLSDANIQMATIKGKTISSLLAEQLKK